MKKKLSLRTELILWSVGILLFYMACQLLFTVTLAQNYTTAQKSHAMHTLMVNLIENYSDSPMDIYTIAEQAQAVDNLRVMVYGENQLIYHTSSVGKMPDRSNLVITHPDKMVERAFFEMQYYDDILFGDVFDFSAPSELLSEFESNVLGLEETFTHNGESRTIAIWSSTLAIDDTVDLFVSVTRRCSIWVIALTVFGVILFSRRITQPITNIEKVASAVADFDFSNKAVEQGYTRELSSLAHSINFMSNNLEDMIEQLNKDKENLSTRVENQEKLDQMRRQFVANISHEMKTPLSMLMMYSESLKLDIPNMDKTFYYDTIIEEATGLNAMVEQLLDTSAVENGLSKVHLVPLDFSQFIQDIVNKSLPLLEKHLLTIDIAEGLRIKGDEKYLEQATRNYISNAVSHCPTGQQISITLEQTDKNVVFRVLNQGMPIEKDDIPFLWDSFYRADKSRSNQGEKRVGLGLYIVKTCISSHFGQVAVENTNDGVQFSYTIPSLEEKIPEE